MKSQLEGVEEENFFEHSQLIQAAILAEIGLIKAGRWFLSESAKSK